MQTQTLTMQGIADLAQVRRPVVSVWRTRYPAASVAPFPEPLSTEPLRFDAEQVAEWLVSTGRGNNRDAGLETALHADAMQRLAGDPDRASALLLLHDVVGGPVRGMAVEAARRHLDDRRLGFLVPPDTLGSALADAELCRAADEVAEAAFSGARALDRLVDGFEGAGGPWADEALTASAKELLAATVVELQRAEPRVVVPAGPGAAVVAGALTRHLDEHELPTVSLPPSSLERVADRAAWRRLAAYGASLLGQDAERGSMVAGPAVAAGTEAASTGQQGRLCLLVAQGARRQELRDLIDGLLTDLTEQDLLMVVGPSLLLTDHAGRHDRVRLLERSPGDVTPLRYVARLPKGLGRFGGRRRLGVWVLGGRPTGWTVVGAHADLRLDAAAVSALASDVTVAVSDVADVRAHAFRSSAVRDTRRLVRQGELIVPADPAVASPSGGERLARAWALSDDLARKRPSESLIDGFDLLAGDTADGRTVGFTEATPRLGRDLPGARIPSERLDVPRPGWAIVVGPDEVRGVAPIGDRGIDRLVLERVAPRARLTEPGDVVYVAAGGPAAIVDDHGGHVVLAPARIFRCLDTDGDHRLLPSVVASDIAEQPGRDRATWRVRTVPGDAAGPLAALTSRTGEHRRRLLRELQTLDALERELIAGFADGTLHADVTPPPTDPIPTPKAAR
ncbi:MAG: hypothetical protein M0P31_00990 [Solirubrobacteraceae bacterium]|nr:hypothetical protein [Solirubrobacteraceae bacterium]